MEDLYIPTNPQYNEGITLRSGDRGVELLRTREYKKGGEDRTAIKFCQPETGYQKFSDKVVPMGVTLGDEPEEAIAVLTNMINHLQGNKAQTSNGGVDGVPWG